jgi:hypothetical protein
MREERGHPDRDRAAGGDALGADLDRDAQKVTRFTAFRQDAERVLREELPSEHPLWKPWALDLADELIAVINGFEELERICGERLRGFPDSGQ